ncbi:MAG: acyltransferase, partial [Planctomycetaceae bacterium]
MSPTVTTSRLSPARRCVGDVARLGRELPLFPVERTMRLAAVAEARDAAATRIGWAAIFAKAYALVARETPALRSWVAGILRPRLATADRSVATLAVNRTEDGADRLCWTRIAAPETLPLAAIQQAIDDALTKPLAEAFARQIELERLPGCLRRTILRWNMR